ncbi:SAF domain-containing protein [Nocardiopsis tropica]|uniref:SAF domain-containing protein n=1 Tax=Nocardiopsis tropica TaxID=109330 RepID=A0ABU7KNJ7_9ACTN|nr:SAF domain-containing protein [Nocardiopsis umidischolae]MEE2050594.1 SAF domain-containing protein [Nocardiopsis umidischolae]
MMVLGVLLVTTCALAGTALVQSMDDRASVLVVARDVPLGQVVVEEDLVSAQISADPAVETVAADQTDAVVGQTATTPLAVGELVTMSKLESAPLPEAGHQLVAIALRPSQLPAQGLRAGDVVQVVSTPGEGGEVPTELPASVRATVLRVGEPDMDGISVVDVQTPATDGAVLAARVATGRIALVVEAPGGGE